MTHLDALRAAAIALPFALLAAPAPVPAQEATADGEGPVAVLELEADAVEVPAYIDHLARLNEGVLTDPQEARLLLLAHDVAVASVCAGFAVDPARFEARFAELVPEDFADLPGDERAALQRQLLVFYGMHVGAALAVAAEDAADTCAIAEAERTNPTVDHVWSVPAD